MCACQGVTSLMSTLPYVLDVAVEVSLVLQVASLSKDTIKL